MRNAPVIHYEHLAKEMHLLHYPQEIDKTVRLHCDPSPTLHTKNCQCRTKSFSLSMYAIGIDHLTVPKLNNQCICSFRALCSRINARRLLCSNSNHHQSKTLTSNPAWPSSAAFIAAFNTRNAVGLFRTISRHLGRHFIIGLRCH